MMDLKRRQRIAKSKSQKPECERRGHSALPFLFISFGNHQVSIHLSTVEWVKAAMNPEGVRALFFR